MTDTAIFFDLDGTLVHLERPYDAVTVETLETHLGASPRALVETYDEAFWTAFGALEDDPVRTAMAAVLEAADGDPDVSPGELAATQREAEFAALTVPDAVPESLAALGEDAALGVLTNGVGDWQRAKLEHVGLADRFDAVVASYEAGAHKPAAEPFALAEQRLPADEYAMVGDSDDDVAGAREAGWVPVRYADDDEGPPFWETVGALL